MRLKSLELDLVWQGDLALQNLRSFILESLQQYGDPLRWSITSIRLSKKEYSRRLLKVEAVVIIS